MLPPSQGAADIGLAGEEGGAHPQLRAMLERLPQMKVESSFKRQCAPSHSLSLIVQCCLPVCLPLFSSRQGADSHRLGCIYVLTFKKTSYDPPSVAQSDALKHPQGTQ